MRPLGWLLCMVLAAPVARAEEPVPWEPGRRTTSRVKGQVETPETDPVTDGVYGRFEGDLELTLGAGVELDDSGQRASGRLALHYFSMLGIATSYGERVGGDGAERVLVVGVDLRPAFIPRWARNMEQGPGFVDLAVDSISLGMGAFWATPPGESFGERRGFELSGGLGVPLFGRAPGPWLEARAIGRWADPNGVDESRGEALGLFMLSWHAFVSTPLAN